MKKYIFFLILFVFIIIDSVLADNEDEIIIKATDGDPYYQFLLGKKFEERNDFYRSKDWLKMACDGGYSEACSYLNVINNKIHNQLIKQFPNLEINDKLNEYNELYNKKDYNKAIEVLNYLCYNKDHLISCNNLAEIYYRGNIIQRDPKKAYDILSIEKLSDNNLSNLYKAWILEYDFGGKSDINNAMILYDKLLKSSLGKIRDEAKLGLDRKYLYKFAEEVFLPFVNYAKGNLKYDQAENMLFNVDVSKIPNNIKDAFYNYRIAFLKMAKNNEESLISIFAKNFSKGYKFDFSFLDDIKNNDNLSLDGKHNMVIILDFLQENKLSAKYLNSIFS